MPMNDQEIMREARRWIALHGGNATAKAREMVEETRRKGDDEGADFWLRIIVAIGLSGTQSADGSH